MTMKVLLIFALFLGLLLGGLILASIRSAEAFPLIDDEEVVDAAKVGRYISDTNLANDRRIDDYIKFLLQAQGKRANQEKPSEGVREFTKNLLQGISKRTSFAISENELQTLPNHERSGKSAYPHVFNGGLGIMRKRNQPKEFHAEGCEAEIHWIFLSQHHFPRFIKSYNCLSTGCGVGGQCSPKKYPVYVLRMNSPESISVLPEDCDSNLPEELRCQWKLVQINVTTYCECKY